MFIVNVIIWNHTRSLNLPTSAFHLHRPNHHTIQGEESVILDHFSDSAMSVLNDVKEQWLRHHVIFSGLVIPDRLGRCSRKQLEGIVLQERIKDGWTHLKLLDGSREVAQARYRWTDELKLEWDPMSHTSPSHPTSTP